MEISFRKMQLALGAILVTAVVAAALPVAGCQQNNSSTATTSVGSICGEDIDQAGTQYVKNGRFEQALSSWKKLENSTSGIDTTQQTTEASCGDELSLTRQNSQGTGLIGLDQPLSISRSSQSSLKLQMIVRIDYQQMTSDGVLGGETPVFVTIDYDKTQGGGGSWTHGFLTNGSTVNYPARDQTIQPEYWHQYTVDDLFKTIPDASRIKGITVAGNGRDFHSRVALVSLLGK